MIRGKAKSKPQTTNLLNFVNILYLLFKLDHFDYMETVKEG